MTIKWGPRFPTCQHQPPSGMARGSSTPALWAQAALPSVLAENNSETWIHVLADSVKEELTVNCSLTLHTWLPIKQGPHPSPWMQCPPPFWPGSISPCFRCWHKAEPPPPRSAAAPGTSPQPQHPTMTGLHEQHTAATTARWQNPCWLPQPLPVCTGEVLPWVTTPPAAGAPAPRAHLCEKHKHILTYKYYTITFPGQLQKGRCNNHKFSLRTNLLQRVLLASHSRLYLAILHLPVLRQNLCRLEASHQLPKAVGPEPLCH